MPQIRGEAFLGVEADTVPDPGSLPRGDEPVGSVDVSAHEFLQVVVAEKLAPAETRRARPIDLAGPSQCCSSGRSGVLRKMLSCPLPAAHTTGSVSPRLTGWY